jgi:prepilin-type N-terminal cleavage/methylation domain-containing protein
MSTPAPRTRGFTLIELLVAVAITSIIIVLLLGMTGVIADAWRNGSNKVFTNAEARAAFNRLTEDLESAVIRDTIPDAEWFQVRMDTGGAFTSEPANPTWLMFFTVPTDRQLFEYKAGSAEYDKEKPIAGNVIGVSYRIVEQDPVKGGESDYRLFGLYRSFPKAVNPAEETFLNILGKPSLDTYWQSRPETEDKDNFYISNIFDFSFTFWITVFDAQGGNARTIPVAPGTELRVKSDKLLVGGTEYPGGKLAAVEISMTILTQQGAVLLREQEIGNDLASFIANPDNSRTYSHKIYFTPEARLSY